MKNVAIILPLSAELDKTDVILKNDRILGYLFTINDANIIFYV